MTNCGNDRLRSAAAIAAKQRKEKVLNNLRDAMATIDQELINSDGLYEYNHGKLNQRELCRRAGIAYITLHSPAHKKTTRIEIQTWLKSKARATRRVAEETKIDRAKYWKSEHAKIATQICIYELELKERDRVILELKSEVDRLGSILAGDNVYSLDRRTANRYDSSGS